MDSPVKTLDLNRTCRACLKTGSTIVQSLLEEPLKSMFYECTFVKVRQTEQLPFNMCSICVALCDAAYNFKEMCEKSDRQIRMPDIKIVTNSQTTETSEVGQKKADPLKPGPSSTKPVQIEAIPPAPQSKPLKTLTVKKKKTIQLIIRPAEVYEDQTEDIIIETEDMEDVAQADEVEDTVETDLADAEIVFESTQDFEDQPEEPDDSDNADVIEEVFETIEEDNSVQCQFCSEVCEDKTELLTHFAENHPNETYDCPNCDHLFNSLHEWRTHICQRPRKEKEKRLYVCEYCPAQSKNHRYFASHLQTAHPGRIYRCDGCSKDFKNADTWRTHMCPGNEMEFVCNYCNAVFGFKAQLTRHMKGHLGTRPKTYQHAKAPCTICRATFHSASYLKQHMLTHTGENPHTCKKCKRGFRNKNNLLRHYRGVHNDKDMKYGDL